MVNPYKMGSTKCKGILKDRLETYDEFLFAFHPTVMATRFAAFEDEVFTALGNTERTKAIYESMAMMIHHGVHLFNCLNEMDNDFQFLLLKVPDGTTVRTAVATMIYPMLCHLTIYFP